MIILNRNRRLRKNNNLRDIIKETSLNLTDIVCPLFICEGKNIIIPLKDMPDINIYSLDNAIKYIKNIYCKGIKAINIYCKVPNHLKDNTGKEAYNCDGLMQKSIREIKNTIPEIIIFSDIALDPYSIYGHDGIIKNGYVDNDETIKILSKIAISHAECGVDFVAPSDMMDGRIGIIRKSLEENNHKLTGILSYSVKYASNFYGPFRNTLDSKPRENNNIKIPKDKRTYQMDYHNSFESLNEVHNDIKEGADIIMIKPAMYYLDIVNKIKNKFDIPVAVFQVSGEYAIIKHGIKNNILDENSILESLISIKRSGANIIFTYFAEYISDLIN